MRITRYVGALSTTVAQLKAAGGSDLRAKSAVYQVQAGQRWEWTKTASLTRTVGGDQNTWSVSHWTFSTGTRNDPWSPNAGTRVTGQDITRPAFEQTITTSDNGDSANRWNMTHGGCGPVCNYGFLQGVGSDRSSYIWRFPDSATITMKMSVKADNPFTVAFAGAGVADVKVTSNAPVILNGKISNSAGATRILVSGGGITQTDRGAIVSRDLTLTSAGAIGTAGTPLEITLDNGARDKITAISTGRQGIALRLASGAVLSTVTAGTAPLLLFGFIPFGGYGDVKIEAQGTLTQVGGTVITGRDVSLGSLTGSIGTASAPVIVAAKPTLGADGTTKGGAVDALASGSVFLTQRGGDLLVGTIKSTGGDVGVRVETGQAYDVRGQTSSGVLSTEQVQAVWARLKLTAEGGADGAGRRRVWRPSSAPSRAATASSGACGSTAPTTRPTATR